MKIYSIIKIPAVYILCQIIFLTHSWAGPHLNWENLLKLPPVGNQKTPTGVAGAFTGVHQNALIIAGGANFNLLYWKDKKEWYDDIWILIKDSENHYEWINAGKLDHPLAYGASVSTEYGVVCIGGNDAERTYSDVFLLSWNPRQKTIVTKKLPSLPNPCAFSSAANIGNKIFLAGGNNSKEPQNTQKYFWFLDLSKETSPEFIWQELPSWPGPNRFLNITIAQHNGIEQCIYLLSGGRSSDTGDVQFLTDFYEFSPSKHDPNNPQSSPWRKRIDIPKCVMGGNGIAVGQSFILILGGDDGSLLHAADSLKKNHPGFSPQGWIYHTITNSWVPAENPPLNQVATHAVKWNEAIFLVSGEIKPRVRTPEIWKANLLKSSNNFGVINFVSILIYLLLLVGVGIFFSYRNQNTNDFFRGGQRVPWWIAGLSIFATMLSSITFIAIPAKAFATDWTFFLINMAIVAVAPLIIYFILPFFRQIDATSAYEYLEKRFNTATRLFASASFVLFQIGRMAIVLFLPALVVSTITPLSVETSILIMGILSIIYCTMGGLEAVVWTDALQAIVLLGGALFCIIYILLNIDGGVEVYISTALADHKFHLINWNWNRDSFIIPALWVVVIGGLGQQLVTGASDQTIIQRYMSVSDEKKAINAIWLNAVFTVPASILFFGVGTALYVFYKFHPGKLDPMSQTDAIFPLFIGHELPAGIAGLVVAGIFAAAQSTISSSMNSTATTIVTDFVRRFSLIGTEKNYLGLARILTFVLGALGTALAIMLATFDVKSLWDSFMSILGLFGGPLCGLFLLGIFTKRANGGGALWGAFLGAAGLFYIQQKTQINFLLYATIGIILCFICGYLLSLITFFKRKSIEDLTILSLRNKFKN